MKKIRFKAFTAVAALVCLFQSCQAAGETGSDSTSFIGKNWQLTALTVDPGVDWDVNGTMDTDILPLLEPCEHDDRIQFRNDHVVVRSGGEKKCDDDEDNIKETGKWTFDQKDKTLVLDEDGEKQKMKLVEISSERMVLKYYFNSTDGVGHTMTAVYQVK